MRFIKEKFPECPDFIPEEQGFISLKEPREKTAMIILNILAAFTLIILTILYFLYDPVIFNDIDTFVFCLFLSSVLIIFPHELIHALCFPAPLLSDKIIIGSNLKMGVFYAFYDAEITKKRLLFVYIMPLVILSVIPLIFILFLYNNIFLASIFIANTAGSVGDIWGITLVLLRTPKNAIIRNKEYLTYYRPG